MIKISDSSRKMFYYVSNINTGALTLIDSSCNSIVKNIFVGKRPFKMAAANNYKLYTACERSNSIAVINCISEEVKSISIPNNGNIQVDELKQRMYISNTHEIGIYDINSNKLIYNIKGFLAITDIKLNKCGSKLYVLDKLLGEFRIYSTADFKLICSINNLVINPGSFLISNDEKAAFISIENFEVETSTYDILIIDIEKKITTGIVLPKGSSIAGMLLNGSTLYAANKGLNRIELININTFKAYDFILTSSHEPNRLTITDDNTKLLVVNRNSGGQGSLDIIDITSNSLISSILMASKNSQPYDVVSVSILTPDTYNVPIAITDLHTTTKEPLIIITKRILAFYQDNIYFPNIIINLNEHNDLSYYFEKIEFENGIIVKGTEAITSIKEMPGFSRFQFLVRTMYTIHYLDIYGNKYNHKGFLEKTDNVIFTTPTKPVVNEYEYDLKTTTKLTNAPKVVDNVFRFGVVSLMKLKIIAEDEISFPSLQHYSQSINFRENLNCEHEYYEIFSDFRGPLFPKDKIIAYTNDYDN